MSKYSVYVVEAENNTYFHCVFEEATQKVCDFFYFPEEAEKRAEFLNNGGAFDGFTPNFMFKEIKKKDLNAIFTEEFA